MASLSSWLSPDIMRALGWALIHSLWQCLAIAALAALLMAFSRRPPLRYTIAVVALGVMLAAPVTTFLLLVRPPATQTIVFQSPPVAAAPITVPPVSARVIAAIQDTPRLVPAQSLFSWLVAAWLAGVVFFSLRFAGGFLLLERKRRQSFAPEARILALCREIQDQLGLNRAIRYLECNWLQAPAVIGWLRPIVLIPVTALTGLSEAQLRAVIAHELAHIRRMDCLVNLFQILAETLLFYHPAVWWLNKRIRAERELCCDEIALSVTGDRLDYAKALTLMAQWEAAPRLAMAANSGVLTERVFHVLGRPSSGIAQRIIGMTGSVLFLATALACANALFVVAAPPIAQAGENVKIGLQTALSAMSDRARQIFPASEPAGKDTGKALPKAEPAIEAPAAAPVPPSADLSQLLPKPTLSTPAVPLEPRTVTASAPPVPASSNGPQPVARPCYNRNVYGRVVSPAVIELLGFNCLLFPNTPGDAAPARISYGSCPQFGTNQQERTTGNRLGRSMCKFDVTMGVKFADPADALLMQPGQMVMLTGRFFRIAAGSRADHLAVTDAKIAGSGSSRATQSLTQPAAKSPPPAATPTLVAQVDAPASSVPPAQALLKTLSAELSPVHFCRNRSVFGQVTAADTVALQGFTCFVDSNPTDTVSARDILLGACPLASSTTAHKNKCKFDVVLNVRLANPADVAKMVPGKLVRMGGDFRTWKEDKLDYVAVTNAKVLFTDYYWTAGISSLPLPMGPPNISPMPVQEYQSNQTPPASPPSNAPQSQ
jgi:beta-lactamase regulating signal transducer with metallopeptidase domain